MAKLISSLALNAAANGEIGNFGADFKTIPSPEAKKNRVP
jgi:hypothetical protein